ncbi:MAG: 2-phospho-L-lactate transferase, partial [Frankiaceae bacterium]|nr:2-phospho-L-lactate transferase [Frankiaceae bacterium]
MQVTVLAGGIGGARFLRGVRAAFPEAALTAIVNTGDDVTMHGLRICPDLDSVMYTLADAVDPQRGWGRRDESWRIKEQLALYGVQPDWFGLGDLDIATHLVRTQMLDAGYPLSDVTAALCARWQPGVRLLPMTDARCETHDIVDAPAPDEAGPPVSAAAAPSPAEAPGDERPAAPARRRAIHFQEWWVRYRAQLPARGFVQIGLESATPAPGVLEAIGAADLLLLAPSNPVVSLGTILAVPGIRDALRAAGAPVIGLSPIIAGAPVRGMADACLAALGVECSARGVAAHYGARRPAPGDDACARRPAPGDA